VAEHRLSLAVNGRENLLYQKLITRRTADRAAAGQKNGHQVTAGSVAIVGLGYVGLDADLGGPDQFFGATHRAMV
jgi:hypothetical protein